MIELILLKERIIDFYNKNEVFITPTVRFLLGLMTLLVINDQLGFFEPLNNILVVLVAALMCSFLPNTLILMTVMLFCLGHFYAIGLEALLIGFAGFTLLSILFLKFVSKEIVVILLIPVLCIVNIPYVIPVTMGLIGTPFSTISVACGLVGYYIILHIKNNAAILSSADADAVQKLRLVIDAILKDKSMMVMLLAFIVALLAVYVIRRMRIDHAWTVAMIAGFVLSVIIILVGDFLFDTNISSFGAIVGILFSLVFTKVIEFFVFNMDYSRTESVQFEDDEYYYYVKAVPKITVSTPMKKVKKINTQQKRPNVRQHR